MFPTGSTHGIKGAMAWHGTLPGGTQEAADRSLVEAPFRHSWCGASTVCCTCTMTKAILLHLSLRNTNPGFPLISGSTCCLPRKDDPKPHRARSVPKRHHHWTRLHTTRGPLTSSHLSDVDLDGSMVFGSDDPVAGRAANTHTYFIKRQLAITCLSNFLPRCSHHFRGTYRSTNSPASFCMLELVRVSPANTSHF